MRSLSRVALLGALAAVAAAPAASAAPSLSHVGEPEQGRHPHPRRADDVHRELRLARAHLDHRRQRPPQGDRREAPRPARLQPDPVREGHLQRGELRRLGQLPSASKLGSATITADGGPEIGEVPATATLFFGSGYSVLARIQASKPAVIDEFVVGKLESSATATDASLGFGLQMFIPVSPKVQMPLDGVYPTVKTFKATIKPMTTKVRVPGVKGRYTMPVAGLGPCKTLKFRVGAYYTNAAGVDTIAQDVADSSAKCKK